MVRSTCLAGFFACALVLVLSMDAEARFRKRRDGTCCVPCCPPCFTQSPSGPLFSYAADMEASVKDEAAAPAWAGWHGVSDPCPAGFDCYCCVGTMLKTCRDIGGAEMCPEGSLVCIRTDMPVMVDCIAFTPQPGPRPGAAPAPAA